MRPIVSALALGAALVAGPAAAKTALVVYTALEADQLKAYEAAFEAANPEIDVRWVRDSTGIVTAKLLAEKNNPQADVVWGLAATSLMLLDAEGMLLPYAPAGVDKVTAQFRDPRAEPTWVGMDVWASAFCVNTKEAEKKSLPIPAGWADLAKPVYKGALVMPNPNSSGTGYLMVSAVLQLMGEDAGWKYLDALHDNMAVYTHSGSKPCRQAGAGEFAVGLSFEYRANDVKKKGAPIEIVLPVEGLGWDVEATGILKTTDNLAEAKKLADWAVTEEANKLYAQSYAIVARDGIAPKLEYISDDLSKRLIKNDFGWAAKNRERILAEWSKRYEGKSEPKS